jgi:hypothetical protein
MEYILRRESRGKYWKGMILSMDIMKLSSLQHKDN